MGRYSKSYSNYVLRKRHQDVEGGTIFERDWGTLGERHVIEKGKKKVYADSNFLFTDNTLSGNKYRNNTGPWSEAYTKESLSENIDMTVNNTSIIDDSNDIRDYAYYGSAAELVRASVENIVKWFPGRFWTTDSPISRLNQSGDGWVYIKSIITDGHHNYAVEYTDNERECNIFVVKNPFTIDFYNTNVVIGKYDNPMRNMPTSFKRYEINGGEIRTWDVWIKPYTNCDENYTIKYDVTIKYLEGNAVKTGHLYGVVINRSVVWCTDIEDMVVQPKETVINQYFNELKGFEAKLLNRQNTPEYTAKLITPIPYGNNNPNYQYVERSYSWPHDGYCILVDNIGFENYFSSLYSMATLMDELWCDNLWRNMTHEAIQNFDWTYTKNYEEGQEEENILGGTRMEGILRIWGRCFDDIKRYIDGISLKNCITYDTTFPNLANAELSDKAGLLGWEIYSTKLNHDDNIYLTNDFLEENEINWYDTKNPESVSQNMVDNDFMNRLVLNSGKIFKSKGTKQAIEMVFAMFGIGQPDFEFKERYYTVTPKRRDDIFYYYKLNTNPDSTEYVGEDSWQWDGTFQEFLNVIKVSPLHGGSPSKAFIEGQCYDLDHMTVGEFCEYMVYAKTNPLNYENDEFSGTPIRDVYINNDHYIVPYFTQDQVYDGHVYFESKGGWGKMADDDYDFNEIKKQEFDYLETIPYMDILQTVGDLITVNMFQIGAKRVFYVIDISDITEYYESLPDDIPISHFFILKDPTSPNQFSSWRNVPSDGVVHTGIPIFDDVTEDDIKLANYNDKLSLDNLGNNPHCGYSDYDMGTEYYEYLETPFKYPIENYGFVHIGDRSAAAQFMFNVVEHNGEKIVNLVDNENEEEYVLPSKLLIIKNNIDNDLYKEYFKGIILKYILQVIPSTTILLLENVKPKVNTYYYYHATEMPGRDTIKLENFNKFTENEFEDEKFESATILLIPETCLATMIIDGGISICECEEGEECEDCFEPLEEGYITDVPEGYKTLSYYFGEEGSGATIIIEQKQ